MNDSDHNPHPQRLYRDTERGVILGVCAGIAWRFDWPLWLTRLCTLAIAWVFPIPTLIAYLVAAVLMPARPLHYCGDGDERSFWRQRGHGG